MTNTIQWKKGRDVFEQAVEALLTRMYAELGTLQIPDGRGGDDGKDAILEHDERRRIFQLKFFPEGFSGGFVKRRDQIKGSFAAAMSNDPTDWTLVVPTKLTISEHAFVQKLLSNYQQSTPKKGQKKSAATPHCTVFDLPRLDSEIAKFPDLVDYLTRDEPLEARAKLFRQEQSELLGGVGDVTDRMRGLKAVIDSKDAHWTIDPSMSGDTVIHTLRAKHPRAAEISPINISFNAVVGNGTEEAAAVERVFGFGSRERVQLSPEMVRDFTFSGPDWLMPSGEISELIFLPDPLKTEPIETQLAFLDAQKRHVATHSGLAHPSSGPKGILLDCEFYGAQLQIFMPTKEGDGGRIDFQSATKPRTVEETLGICDIMESMSEAHTFSIRLRGHQVASMRTSPVDPEVVRGQQYTKLLAEDLRVIQHAARVSFPVPNELTLLERVDIRNVRLMLEGQVVVHPQWNTITATLNGEHTEQVLDLLTKPGHLVVATGEGEPTLLAGQELFLPEIHFVVTNARLADSDKVVDAIKAGHAEGLQIRMKAQPNEHIRLYMPSRLSDPNTPLIPVTWDIPGVDQVGIASPEMNVSATENEEQPRQIAAESESDLAVSSRPETSTVRED